MARLIGRLAHAPLVLIGTTGSRPEPIPGHIVPGDWSIWGSDGRVVPTPGWYRIDFDGHVRLRIRRPGAIYEDVGSLPYRVHVIPDTHIYPISIGSDPQPYVMEIQRL